MEHEDQITLRLPSDLAKNIARTAKERHISKAQLIREALVAYMGQARPLTPEEVRERSAPFVGLVSYDPYQSGTDVIADAIYRHNVRE